MRKPLLHKEHINRIKKNIILFGLIMSILPLFIAFHSLVFLQNQNLFINGMILSLIFYLLGFISFFIGYIREPAKIVEITVDGFTYLPVLGGKRTVLWGDVIDFKENPDIKTVYIVSRSLFGETRIPFRSDVGERLRSEWEKWKISKKVKSV